MKQIKRIIYQNIKEQLKRGKSVLLLGARQTGKTTMLSTFDVDISINLMDTELRRRYEARPELFTQEIRLAHETKQNLRIFIDEIQKVPELLDNIQVLIDEKIAQFIITGSSARKLRQPPVNLLPGRVVKMQLDGLTLNEIDLSKTQIEDLLLYGTLPGIFLEPSAINKELDLRSYVDIYLEEEIRAEAVVRKVGDFSKFLELAAAESGYILNMSKLSNQIGVTQKTIENYFQILEDCLVAEKMEAITETKARRRLSHSKRYLMYDLGVRRISANEGTALPTKYMGHLFEQFIGQQLIFMLRQTCPRATVKFWRDSNGLEVDWVIEIDKQYIPIEIKWSDAPNSKMTKPCHIFIEEYDNCPLGGFIVCRTPRDFKVSENITAISWKSLPSLITKVSKNL